MKSCKPLYFRKKIDGLQSTIEELKKQFEDSKVKYDEAVICIEKGTKMKKDAINNMENYRSKLERHVQDIKLTFESENSRRSKSSPFSPYSNRLAPPDIDIPKVPRSW